MDGSKSYDKAYDNAMQRIDSQNTDQKNLAREVLSWITCARRPLTTAELLHALAVAFGDSDLDEENIPDLDFILFLCAGLVVVTGDRTAIRLVHYTTQEYFERTSSRWFPDVNKTMAATCLTYLSFEAFQSGICLTDSEFEARLDNYPFYCYAAKNWAHHVSGDTATQDLAMNFLRSPPKVQGSVQAIFAINAPSNKGDYCRQTPEGFTGLHLAAYLGLADIVRYLIHTSDLPLQTTASDRSPLGWAAYAGHASVVDIFLGSGYHPYEVDANGRTPMSLAAYKGQASVIVLLISYQVDPSDHDVDGQSPLLQAADQGHEEATRVLLENNVAPDFRDSDGQTPLMYAASNGWTEIAQLLLTKSADPNLQDIYGRTALGWAVKTANSALTKLLLDHGARVGLHSSPASRSSHYDVAFPFHDTRTFEAPRQHVGRIRHEEHRLNCPFCPSDGQPVYPSFGSLKRHISVHHFPEGRYVCTELSCMNGIKRTSFLRRDRFIQHLTSIHEQFDLPREYTHRRWERMPHPERCLVCKVPLTSWSAFWGCVKHHGYNPSSSCQLDQGPGSHKTKLQEPSSIDAK
jgi:ankyrin repeat protein